MMQKSISFENYREMAGDVLREPVSSLEPEALKWFNVLIDTAPRPFRQRDVDLVEEAALLQVKICRNQASTQELRRLFELFDLFRMAGVGSRVGMRGIRVKPLSAEFWRD